MERVGFVVAGVYCSCRIYAYYDVGLKKIFRTPLGTWLAVIDDEAEAVRTFLFGKEINQRAPRNRSFVSEFKLLEAKSERSITMQITYSDGTSSVIELNKKGVQILLTCIYPKPDQLIRAINESGERVLFSIMRGAYETSMYPIRLPKLPIN